MTLLINVMLALLLSVSIFSRYVRVSGRRTCVANNCLHLLDSDVCHYSSLLAISSRRFHSAWSNRLLVSAYSSLLMTSISGLSSGRLRWRVSQQQISDVFHSATKLSTASHQLVSHSIYTSHNRVHLVGARLRFRGIHAVVAKIPSSRVSSLFTTFACICLHCRSNPSSSRLVS